MKNIIRLAVILLTCMFCSTTHGQVSTPNGINNVSYQIYGASAAGDVAALEQEAADWLAEQGWTNDVIKTAPATAEYNCHSYAWNMSEEGITCWIDVPNQYWIDKSYIEVSESEATKVLYAWGEHSAVRITSGEHAGKYESKWGSLPRYIHPYDKSPYYYPERQFYVRPIIGSKVACCSGSSFTFNLPSGTISWTVTGPFSFSPTSVLTSTTGNPVTVYATGAGTGTLTSSTSAWGIIPKTIISAVNYSNGQTVASCGDINFQNVIVTTITYNSANHTTVTSCGDIDVQNVTVTSFGSSEPYRTRAKLTLDAAGEVNITSDFEVELGSELEIK